MFFNAPVATLASMPQEPEEGLGPRMWEMEEQRRGLLERLAEVEEQLVSGVGEALVAGLHEELARLAARRAALQGTLDRAKEENGALREKIEKSRARKNKFEVTREQKLHLVEKIKERSDLVIRLRNKIVMKSKEVGFEDILEEVSNDQAVRKNDEEVRKASEGEGSEGAASSTTSALQSSMTEVEEMDIVPQCVEGQVEGERRRCRDVVVPSWRVVEVGEEVEEEGEVEDMRDEVYLERHAKGEVEERMRWLSQVLSRRVGRRSMGAGSAGQAPTAMAAATMAAESVTRRPAAAGMGRAANTISCPLCPFTTTVKGNACTRDRCLLVHQANRHFKEKVSHL